MSPFMEYCVVTCVLTVCKSLDAAVAWACEPDVHLLHLIEEGLLQMEALPERNGLDSSKSLQDSDMARFYDHTRSDEDDHEQNDDENDRNETFKRRIHRMQVMISCFSNRTLHGCNPKDDGDKIRASSRAAHVRGSIFFAGSNRFVAWRQFN
jgi:hypothetical protein